MTADLNTYYVPWPDTSEWNTVKQRIFSWDVRDIAKAYETILMWKLKYDSIPAYIECTYSLLQVMIKEYEITENESSCSLYKEHDLQLSYSTALIRFVNHVFSINSSRGDTLYLAAKALNIPDWIINLRHDAAHGQALPALDALHVAAQLSLQWLLDNYWSNEESLVGKTLHSPLNKLHPGSTAEVNFNVGNFFKKALHIWELCCSKKQKLVIGDMEQEFFFHLEEMLNLNSIYTFNLNTDAVKNLQIIIRNWNKPGKEKSTLSLKEFKKVMLNFLKNATEVDAQAKNCLVMSLLETTFLSATSFEPLKWKQILWLLQELKLFSMLVEILFEMAGKGHGGASNWLTALLPSIRLLKKQWATFKIIKRENSCCKSNVLRKKVEKSFKNKDRDSLIRLKIFKPPVLDFEMMKGVLLNPDFLSVNVIVEYLKLAKPPLPKRTIQLMKDLMTLRAEGGEGAAEAGDSCDENIYTLEDVSMKNVVVVHEEADVETNGWAKTTIGVEAWSKCPLGLLPFQTKVDCSLPDDLKWKTNRSSSSKRVAIPLIRHSTNMKKMRFL